VLARPDLKAIHEIPEIQATQVILEPLVRLETPEFPATQVKLERLELAE
jgi:hypothetical protein